MTKYRPFANMTVGGVSAAERRRQKEREEAEAAAQTQASLVARSSALAKLADHMAQQNEKMLAGLRAVSTKDEKPPGKVDFIARNMANVSASRPTMDRKEQALIARAQAMAKATAHLTGGGASASVATRRAESMPVPVRSVGPNLGASSRQRFAAADEDDILAMALAEIEHGQTMTRFESQTRRAPPKSYR